MLNLMKVICLFSPLLVGLAFHGLCMKFNWLSGFAQPVDGGRTFRGRPLFGGNKTYRGIIAVGIGTAIAFVIAGLVLRGTADGRQIEIFEFGGWRLALLGLAVGLAAMCSELPNSLVKRQFGITPGTPGRGLIGAVFYFVDQVDVLAGSWIVFALVIPVTTGMILWSIVFLFLAHQLMSVIGYGLGIRTTMR